MDRTLLITMTNQVVGAEIRTFLLERSRVTSTSKPLERAYHIMYQVYLTLALTLALALALALAPILAQALSPILIFTRSLSAQLLWGHRSSRPAP